jgi:hypothetical protein
VFIVYKRFFYFFSGKNVFFPDFFSLPSTWSCPDGRTHNS